MNVIVCLDDKNGMMFNKRRQSQDLTLRIDIKNLVQNRNIFMNNYSYKLYKDIDIGNIRVCENFLDECGNNDFCLVEDKLLSNYINKINNLIIYNWNRVYPSDLYFDINLQNNIWNLVDEQEFEGSSHEKITKKIYRRIH